jgi:hypothetical protein
MRTVIVIACLALIVLTQGCGGGGDDPEHPDVIVCNSAQDCPIHGPYIQPDPGVQPVRRN